MTLDEVKKLIEDNKVKGYLVHFKEIGDGFTRHDYFPEDVPFLTEEIAWKWAEDFSKSCPWYVNIFVVDINLVPVDGYRKKLYNPQWNLKPHV